MLRESLDQLVNLKITHCAGSIAQERHQDHFSRIGPERYWIPENILGLKVRSRHLICQFHKILPTALTIGTTLRQMKGSVFLYPDKKLLKTANLADAHLFSHLTQSLSLRSQASDNPSPTQAGRGTLRQQLPFSSACATYWSPGEKGSGD